MRTEKTAKLIVALILVFSMLIPSGVMASAGKVIDETSIAINYGTSKKLTAKSKNVSFSTSDKKVACVDKNGTVKSMGSGTCTITARDKSTGETEKCRVIVKVVYWKIFSNLIYYIKNRNCPVCNGQGDDDTTTESTTQSTTEPVTTPSTEPVTVPSTEPVTSPSTEPSSGSTSPSTEPTTRETTTTTEPAELDGISSFGGTMSDVISGSDGKGGYYYSCGRTGSKDGDFSDMPDLVKMFGYYFPCGYVRRYDSSGNYLWTAYLYPRDASEIKGVKSGSIKSFNIIATDVCTLKSGNAAVCGYKTVEYDVTTTVNTSEGISTETTSSVYNISPYIAEIGADGTILWEKTLSGTGTGTYECIAATSDGFVVGGKTFATDGDFTGNEKFSETVDGETVTYNVASSVLTRYKISTDDSGNNSAAAVWSRYMSGEYDIQYTGVSVDQYNNVFAVVSTNAVKGDMAQYTDLITDSIDNIVIKYNNAGEKQWANVLATKYVDHFDSVAADGSGGCVAAGYFTSSGVSTVTNLGGTFSSNYSLGGSDSFVIRFGTDGTKTWQKQITGSYDDCVTDIVRSGSVYIVGGYKKSSDRDFNINYGGTDGFIEVISSTGTKVAVYNLGGSEDDKVTTIAVSNGELMVFGSSLSTDEFFEGMNQYADADSTPVMADCFEVKYKINV